MKELEQYQQTEAYKIFKKQQEKKRKGMYEKYIYNKMFLISSTSIFLKI